MKAARPSTARREIAIKIKIKKAAGARFHSQLALASARPELSSGWGQCVTRAWRVGFVPLYACGSPPTAALVTAVAFVAVERVEARARARSARKEGGEVMGM